MSALLGPRFLPGGEYDWEAGRARIAANNAASNARADRLTHAFSVLRADCTTETAAVYALHAISAGLMSAKPLASTDILETVGWIDELADQIKYRNAS